MGLRRQILAANQGVAWNGINTIQFSSMGTPFINLDFDGILSASFLH